MKYVIFICLGCWGRRIEGKFARGKARIELRGTEKSGKKKRENERKVPKEIR